MPHLHHCRRRGHHPRLGVLVWPLEPSIRPLGFGAALAGAAAAIKSVEEGGKRRREEKLHHHRLVPAQIMAVAGSPAEPHAAYAGGHPLTPPTPPTRGRAPLPPSLQTARPCRRHAPAAAQLEKGRRGRQQLGFTWPSESPREGDVGWWGRKGSCPSTAYTIYDRVPTGMIL